MHLRNIRKCRVSIATGNHKHLGQFDAVSVVIYFFEDQRSARNAADFWLFNMSPSAKSGTLHGCLGLVFTRGDLVAAGGVLSLTAFLILLVGLVAEGDVFNSPGSGTFRD